MTDRVADLYDNVGDFERLLDGAEESADAGGDIDFVAGVRERFDKWGGAMYLYDGERDRLGKIAKEET